MTRERNLSVDMFLAMAVCVAVAAVVFAPLLGYRIVQLKTENAALREAVGAMLRPKPQPRAFPDLPASCCSCNVLRTPDGKCNCRWEDSGRDACTCK